jgi:hypothetical protein
VVESAKPDPEIEVLQAHKSPFVMIICILIHPHSQVCSHPVRVELCAPTYGTLLRISTMIDHNHSNRVKPQLIHAGCVIAVHGVGSKLGRGLLNSKSSAWQRRRQFSSTFSTVPDTTPDTTNNQPPRASRTSARLHCLCYCVRTIHRIVIFLIQ